MNTSRLFTFIIISYIFVSMYLWLCHCLTYYNKNPKHHHKPKTHMSTTLLNDLQILIFLKFEIARLITFCLISMVTHTTFVFNSLSCFVIVPSWTWHYDSLCSLQNLIHFMRGYGCLSSKYFFYFFCVFCVLRRGSWMHCPTWIQLKLMFKDKLNVNSFSNFPLCLFVFLK